MTEETPEEFLDKQQLTLPEYKGKWLVRGQADWAINLARKQEQEAKYNHTYLQRIKAEAEERGRQEERERWIPATGNKEIVKLFAEISMNTNQKASHLFNAFINEVYDNVNQIHAKVEACIRADTAKEILKRYQDCTITELDDFEEWIKTNYLSGSRDSPRLVTKPEIDISGKAGPTQSKGDGDSGHATPNRPCTDSANASSDTSGNAHASPKAPENKKR